MNKDMWNFCISELALQGNLDPTAEEINQFYENYMAEGAKERNNKEARKLYEAALECGYTHTDGKVYYCTRDGVIDAALALMLLQVAPYEPVYVQQLNGTVTEMTAVEYEAFVVAVGQYHYKLRQTYWDTLL